MIATLLQSLRDAWRAAPAPGDTRPGWTRKQRKWVWADPPSILDWIPWRCWDAESGTILFADHVHCGALFELTPAATEGRDADSIEQLHHALWQAVKTGLPEEDEPWIAQFYVNDEASLYPLWVRTQEAAEKLADEPFTQSWLRELDAHFQQVADPQGLFQDAGGQVWRGRERRVFCTLYREGAYRTHSAAAEDLSQAALRFVAAFQQHGVQLRRCRGEEMWRWLLPWLHPAPWSTDGNPYQLLRSTCYPDEQHGHSRAERDLPPMPDLNFDLGESVVGQEVRHDADGTFWFDEVPMLALGLQRLEQIPKIGHLTGERRFGEQSRTLFDALPEGTRMVLTLVAQPQHQVREHLERLTRSAVGDGADARETRLQIEQVTDAMARGEKLYPIQLVFYVRAAAAQDRASLERRLRELPSVLQPEGLRLFERRHDLFLGRTFLRNLPFCFSWKEDRALPRRAIYEYGHHIASLLPMYGRFRGTQNPGLQYFNRGAEPLTFDPIRDRIKNAHMNILGPSGSGKSATITNALCQMMALHKPRLWIIDPKWPAPSFTLLAGYFESQGLKVHHVRLTPSTDIAINPFAEAYTLLDQFEAGGSRLAFEAGEDRDLAGEMTLMLKAMITGGEQRELDRLVRADTSVLSDAILEAARIARERGAPQTLCVDVVEALERLAAKEPDGGMRLREMGRALRYFTKDLAGRFFNRPSTPWPDADVTLVEMGVLGTRGYEDQLSVAFMSLLQAVQADVTRRQYGERNTLFVVDEIHLIARNPVLGPMIYQIVKTWRSVGAWYWQATQNVGDFAGSMRELLANMEWWVCLSMPKSEVDAIQQLRELTAEQRSMLLAATKEPGKYVEGVVLHDRYSSLFRAVVPPLALALAQTEQHERAHRAQLMEQHGITELEAARRVALEIAAERTSTAGHSSRWSAG